MLSTCPYCLNSLKFKVYGFTATLFGFCQRKQAQSSGDKKSKNIICTPTVSDTMDKSKQGRSTRGNSLALAMTISHPHARIVIISPSTSESTFFGQTATHDSCPMAPSIKKPNGPSLLSYQIIVEIRQACLLDPSHTPHLDIITTPKDIRRQTERPLLPTFCPVGKHPKSGRHIF